MFGAALVPLSQAVMYDIYPPEKRGTAMSVWTMGVMIGPISVPYWRLADRKLQLALGVLHQRAVRHRDRGIGLLKFLKETSHGQSARLDWLGFGALSLAIGALQMMLDRGETLDWFARGKSRRGVHAGMGFYVFLVQFSSRRGLSYRPNCSRILNFVVGVIL